MVEYVVKLPVRPFIASWLETLYGSPVRFPARSVENMVLRSVTVKHRSRQEAARGMRCLESAQSFVTVEIALPDCSWHKPSVYHYLTRSGRRTLMQLVNDRFQSHLYDTLTDATGRGMLLMDAVYGFCRSTGIDLDHSGTVLQRFYRMRSAHQGVGLKTRLRGMPSGHKSEVLVK